MCCVHIIQFSVVQSVPRRAMTKGTIKTTTHSISPGQDERGRCVHWTVYMYLLFSGIQSGPGRAIAEGTILKQTPIQLRRDGRARTMCTCIYCLVEYSLDQDEPWLEGTIIPNTSQLRRIGRARMMCTMYLLFGGVHAACSRTSHGWRRSL
jgi:hypothetical protein